MLTIDQLSVIMPNAKKKDEIVDALNEAMPRFDIYTPDQQCMFLANLAHESGEYRWMEEIWGPTKAQQTYERDFDEPWGPTLRRNQRNFKAYSLGNSEPGDGRRFSGHGPIQITGRTNHVIIGHILELDLVENPLLITEIRWGTLAAGAFWFNNNLNRKVEQGFEAVVRAINGGTNGMADRQKYLARARQVI